jgi:hypothetical protein
MVLFMARYLKDLNVLNFSRVTRHDLDDVFLEADYVSEGRS